MRIIFLLFLVSLLTFPYVSITHQVLIRHYGGTAIDGGYAIAPTLDNGYYLGGDSYSYGHPNGNSDVWVIKIDAAGDIQWDQTAGCSGQDQSQALTATPDGGCIAGGSTYCGGGGKKGYVAKFGPNGNLEWHKPIALTNHQIVGISRVSDGSYMIISTNLLDAVYGQVSSSGDLMWSNTIATSNILRSICEDGNGNFAVIGYYNMERCDFFLFDSSGAILAQNSNIARGGYSYCQKIVRTSDGNFMVAAHTGASSGLQKDAWMLKLSPSGMILIDKVWSGSLHSEKAWSVGEMSNKNFIWAGSRYISGMDDQLWVFVTDEEGNPITEYLYGDSNKQQGKDLHIYPTDAVGVVGYALTATKSYEYYVVLRPGCGEGSFLEKATDTCKVCYPLCQKCHGVTNTDCDQCKAGVLNMVPFHDSTCECKLGYYLDPTITQPEDYCQKCPIFCTSCTYEGCLTCIEGEGIVLTEGSCECSANDYFFYQNPMTLAPECVHCHPLCLGCIGPSVTECTLCDPAKGAVQISSGTCGCPSGTFYDIVVQECLQCSYLCAECYGTTSEECYNCNYDVAYEVEDQPNKCVSDCDTCYFEDGRVCRRCHPSCKECRGPQSNQCLECQDPAQVIYEGQCKDNCPSHYYTLNHICCECHPDCAECFIGSKYGCISCPSGTFLLNNQCVNNCPNGMYEGNQDCKACIFPCETCSSASECITCSPGFFFDRSTNTCTMLCPSKTYPEPLTKACEPCSNACLECAGPTSKDCLSCDLCKGLQKVGANIGPCIPITCGVGSYPEILPLVCKASCQQCHSSCEACVGPGPYNCIECKPDLVVIPTSDSGTVTCRTCEEVSLGYTTTSEGKCVEICGDGMNMGQVECDDGNRVNDDGCSADCKIEKGYACHSREDLPDLCVSLTPPQAKLLVKRGGILVIKFNERVKTNVDSKELAASINVTLVDTRSTCEFAWNFAPEFMPSKPFNALPIHTSIKCSIKGNSEKYIVKFNDASLISDLSNNSLSTTVLSAKALRYLYISPEEKENIENAGTAFSASSFFTFALVICVNLLQAAAVGSFWAFINMLQILSYIPVINCDLPHNLKVFITQYLSVSKVTIPFKLLPIPGPLGWTANFLTKPLNEKFEDCGYETLSFLFNFAEDLSTWALLLLVYGLLNILCYCFPKEKCKMLHNWKKEYEYNAIIRLLLECYLNLVFCAIISIWELDMSTTSQKVSLGAAYIGGYLSGIFLIISLRLVENPRKKLVSKSFKEEYGTIIEDIKLDSVYSRRYYYPIYLIRRIYYATVLVVLYDHPIIQLILIPFGLLAPMLAYLLVCVPFTDSYLNLLNIYNECVTIIAYLGILLTNVLLFEEEAIKMLGWCLIGLIFISLLMTWILLIPGVVKAGIEALRSYCRKTESNDSEYSISNQVRVKKVHSEGGTIGANKEERVNKRVGRVRGNGKIRIYDSA